MEHIAMWKISGTAVQGVGHEEAAIPCQDKIYSLRRNGVISSALADGAGSARLSHFGAEEAVQAVCEKLCDDFRDILSSRDVLTAKKEILDALISRLEALADDKGCSIDDLASTLIAAACDDEYVMLVHIGDGVAGYFKDGKLSVASYPDNGEFKNETVFTTSPDALQRMRLMKGKAEGISGFILMSDGTAESFYDKKGKSFVPLADEIKQQCIIRPEEQSSESLSVLFSNIVRHTNTRDDCSIVIMCRPDDSFRGLRDLSGSERAALLSAKTEDGQANRENLLGIFAARDYCLSRSEIISEASKIGLDRRQILGLLRDMCRRGIIERVYPKVYRLCLRY